MIKATDWLADAVVGLEDLIAPSSEADRRSRGYRASAYIIRWSEKVAQETHIYQVKAKFESLLRKRKRAEFTEKHRQAFFVLEKRYPKRTRSEKSQAPLFVPWSKGPSTIIATFPSAKELRTASLASTITNISSTFYPGSPESSPSCCTVSDTVSDVPIDWYYWPDYMWDPICRTPSCEVWTTLSPKTDRY
ncbi:hypothetical protein N7462_003684 [Penicillium macrosclerotiorum]|uniref:uncharacterized protein n=1 Tax=Penicillium macrosclerotiorum TaxID=303699 RepID=UPI002547832C|nr:uncharacterized protein N7462_003684 [Penicillium macrosclerotiorum]KAJ5689292.1 hypothetical protein N7462_003684 [Penicillium macrosclerotiorum]